MPKILMKGPFKTEKKAVEYIQTNYPNGKYIGVQGDTHKLGNGKYIDSEGSPHVFRIEEMC